MLNINPFLRLSQSNFAQQPDCNETFDRLLRDRPVTAEKVQACVFNPAALPADVRLGYARAVYKRGKAGLDEASRAALQGELFEAMCVPEATVRKYRERKEAARSRRGDRAEHSAEPVQNVPQQLGRGDFPRHSRRDDHLCIRLRGQECTISRDAIDSHPQSVLAELCQSVSSSVVTLPESAPLTMELLEDVAAFYHGQPRPYYTHARGAALARAAEYLGLEDLRLHIRNHTDSPSSCPLKDIKEEVARVNQTLESFHGFDLERELNRGAHPLLNSLPRRGLMDPIKEELSKITALLRANQEATRPAGPGAWSTNDHLGIPRVWSGNERPQHQW